MENEVSYKIIGAALEVHKSLGGPGLLESVYEEALCHELLLRGHTVQRQLKVPIVYKGVTISQPLCLDLIVDEKVIVEVKATEKQLLVYESQLYTYLRLTERKLGLVINFGCRLLKDGIFRVVNEL